MNSLEGKIAAVTGGTSGIGRAIARGLVAEGARVVLLVRDLERGQKAASQIGAGVPAAKVECVQGDLRSLSSVRKAASEIQASYPRLDVLVCAAGVFHKQRRETEDGIEETFAVNYLSQFLLVNLLEPCLQRAAPSRVVFIASKYGGMRIDFDDLMIKQRKFTVAGSVAPTKLAEILLAQELAQRWSGLGIVVNAVHPGLVAHTHLLDEVGGFWKWVTNTFGGTPEKGADTAIWLASAPEAGSISGKLLAKRKPIATPGQGSDPAARARLWTESLRLAGLGPVPAT